MYGVHSFTRRLITRYDQVHTATTGVPVVGVPPPSTLKTDGVLGLRENTLPQRVHFHNVYSSVIDQDSKLHWFCLVTVGVGFPTDDMTYCQCR